VVGVVGQEQTQQEVLQRRVVFLVPERGLDEAPERLVEVELLDLFPGIGLYTSL